MCIWLYALIWVLLQFGTRNGYVLEGFRTTCSFDYFSRDIVSHILMSSMLVGGFLVPFIILIVSIVLTRISLSRKTKEMGQEHFVFTSIPTTNTAKQYDQQCNSTLDGSVRSKTQQQESQCRRLKANRFSYQKRENRVLRTIIFNMIGFCIAWGPYAIITTFAQFSEYSDIYVTPITTSLPALFAKTSAIYNPILYTLTNQECRKYFRRTLFSLKKKKAPRFDIY